MSAETRGYLCLEAWKTKRRWSQWKNAWLKDAPDKAQPARMGIHRFTELFWLEGTFETIGSNPHPALVQAHPCPSQARWAWPCWLCLYLRKKKRNWGRTDLLGAAFLSIPCFGPPAIKFLAFRGPHLDFSVQMIFVSQTISLRLKLCSVLIIQWMIWVRQTRLLDPHWGANLSYAQTIHIACTCPSVTGGSTSYLFSCLAEERKHHWTSSCEKRLRNPAVLNELYFNIYKEVGKRKIVVITIKTALCCLKYSSVLDYHIKLLALFTKENQTLDHASTEPKTFSHFSVLIFQMV